MADDRIAVPFPAYGELLLDALICRGAPAHVTETVREVHEHAVRDLMYKAPEVVADACDDAKLDLYHLLLRLHVSGAPWCDAMRGFFAAYK